jgi:hypothetical protein
MFFKVSNTNYEESRRVVDDTISDKLSETITTTATLDPYIATSKLQIGTYTVTLPNAEPGTIKIVTLLESGEATVTISYTDGFGDPSTRNMSSRGQLIIFYATSVGWHARTYLD